MPTDADSLRDASSILAALRDSRQRLERDGVDAAARVATMNFVVFTDDPEYRSWVLERAAMVVEKHHSRLIVLDSTDATTGISVDSSMRTTGGAPMINERVDIAVRSLGHREIISLVGELAVPEIPLVLWWSGARLLQSRTFSGLAQRAQTVVVDSSGKARDKETIAELGEFLTRFPSVVLQDLAFMRLAPWQDMIAQFFDDPALREDLFSISGLEITSGSEAEALYLAGWLGSRLSWQPVGHDSFLDRNGRTIPVTKIDRGDQRRVLSVVLDAGSSVYQAKLSSDDPGVVCLTVSGMRAKPQWWMPLRNIENTSLIERAILEHDRDRIFETSLLAVRDLLG